MILNFDLLLLLTLGNLCFVDCMSFLSIWRDRDIRKALHLCPQRWELMGAIRAGGPLRFLVQPNQTIVLQCRFCEDPAEETDDDDDIGMWTFVDIIRGSAPVRVPRPVGDDSATKRSFFGLGQKPRIVIAEGQSLALRKPRTTDLGLYQCRRDSDNSSIGSMARILIDMDIALFEGQLKREKENKVNEKDEEDEDSEENESTTKNTSTAAQVTDEENDFLNETPPMNGTFADWPAYRADHLDSLDKVIIRSKLHLEAISEWSPWTECRDCWTTEKGIRARRGVCVVRVPLHETENDDVIANELRGLPALACRSTVFSRLHPEVGAAARKVPDFIEFDYQGCNGVCGRNDSQSHGSLLHRLVYLFRHRRDTPLTMHERMTINAGEALVIVCPDSTAETPVHWEKDGEAIGGGRVKAKIHKRNPVQQILTKMREMERWVSGELVGIKGAPENTPFVDSAGVLRVQKVAPRNSGNYECSVNGTPRGTFQVEVIAKSALSFNDLMRSFSYVSLVLLSCIMIWCGVVICVSLRQRFRKNKYSTLPQSSRQAPQSFPPGQGSRSRPDTPKSDGDTEESTLDNAGKSGKRKTKRKPASHTPSRKSSRAANDRFRPPSPPTASYHKVPSRLRIRHLSRLVSRSSANNNEIELVRLLPPKSSMHLTNYRSEQPGTTRRCYRQQYSSASFSSVDLDEVETTADRGSVIVLSQQLFPASQKALRPLPFSSNQSQFRAHRSSVEPVPNRAQLLMQQRARSVSRSPCSWAPSAISASVLRARNNLRQAKPASPSSNTPKLNKSVHISEIPVQSRHSSEKAGTPKEANVRAGKRRKRYKRMKSSKPRKSRSQASQISHGKAGKTLKKRRGLSSSQTSSQTKSTVRRKPIVPQPKSSPRQMGPIKSSVSRLTTSPVYFSKQNSPLHSGCVRSPGKTSPRLSLLYKALPSPKPTASSSNSRDYVSSISFLSNSAGNSAIDTQDPSRRENSVEPIKASGEVILSNTAERETNEPPVPDDRKILSVSAQSSAVVSKGSLRRPMRSTQTITSRHQTRSSIYLPPDSNSQQSMFEIKKVTENQTRPSFPDLPSPTGPSTILRGFQTAQLEQSDSLEKLKLVAAFLETSAQRTSQSQSSDCLPATRQVQLLNPKPTSQGSFLVPPSVVVASPRQSEMSLPTATPPVTSGSSNCTKCNVVHRESASTPPSDALKHSSVTLRSQQVHPKSSKILAAISRRKSPIQSEPCLQANAYSKSQTQRITEVSRKLLPALLSPCAIAMPDHAPVVNKLIRTGSPLLPWESSPELKKLKPLSRAGTQQSGMSSVRSSTSTQSAFNPFTEPQEILETPEKNGKRSIPSSNTDSVSRLRFAVEEVLEDERANVQRAQTSFGTSPVKDLTVQLSEGKIAGSGCAPPKMGKVVSLQEPNRCTGSRPDLFTVFRESRSEDVSLGRFRTSKSETENRGSSHSGWVGAHHKTTTKPNPNETLEYSDNSKEAVFGTTLRKIASTRFSKHKGYFVRQKPVQVVDRLELVVVDTDKLRQETLNPEQNESFSREPATSRLKERSKSRSRSAVFESVTKSIPPATAIAFPQISANVLWPVNPQSSVSQLTPSESQRESRSEPLLSESSFQPVPEISRGSTCPSSHITCSHTASPRLQEIATVVSKRDSTKGSRETRSKPRFYTVINRSNKTSHVSMPCNQFKLKQKAKHDTSNSGAAYDFEFARSTFNITHLKPQSPRGSFNHRGFNPPLELKLTHSLPQTSGSPLISDLIGTPDFISKSLGEVKAKPSMKSHTSKPPTSPPTPLHPQSSFLQDSRYVGQLLARDPSTISSHTTQVEKGDILNTCDAEVQSVILHQPEHTIQRPHEGVRDESTSFGSLSETTPKSRRVRLETTEMASQVSNLRTAPQEAPNFHTFFTKRQQFTPRRSRPATTKVRSQPTATPPPVAQRTNVEQTNFKSRLMKSPYDHVTRLSPPSIHYYESPTFNYPLSPPQTAPPSRLPIPVKKNAQRGKLGESRLTIPKPPVPPKLTRTRVRRPPATPTGAKLHSGRATGAGNSKSPTPRRSPRRPSPIVDHESPTLKVGFSGHRLSPISSRPFKSGTLCDGAEQMAEDIERTTAFEDYDSHHIVSESQIPTDQCKTENQQTSSHVNTAIKQASLLQSHLCPSKSPFSSMLTTDNLKPAFSGALAKAAQGIIAISMTRTVPNQPEIRIFEPEFQTTNVIKESLLTKDVTNSQTGIHRPGRSCSQPSIRRKSRQKLTRKHIRRSLTSVPYTSKIGPSVTRSSPSRPKVPESRVFVFGAQEQHQRVPTAGQNFLLPTKRDFRKGSQDVLNSSISPDFLQDGFTSVRAISNVAFEREKQQGSNRIQK